MTHKEWLQAAREEYKDKCCTCKHVKQGENNMFCNNPKQTDQELKTYVYPPIYQCNLHESIWATLQ
jgi:hypothetical protein